LAVEAFAEAFASICQEIGVHTKAKGTQVFCLGVGAVAELVGIS
jgi:hypothetical protein